MLKYYAIAAVVAVLAGLGLMYAAPVLIAQFRGDDGFGPCRETVIASDSGTLGGPFTLTDASGADVSSDEVFARPGLLYFGYTFCPDVCPLDTVRNADAAALLRERGYDIRPVFVSVDPRRDTPDVVGDFASNIDETMVGLTGTEAQIGAAAKAYGAFFRAHDADDDYYLVDHSTFTYLVLPEHGFVEFFRRDLAPEALAERVSCFLDAA